MNDFFFVVAPQLRSLIVFCNSTFAPQVLFIMSPCFDAPTITYKLPPLKVSIGTLKRDSDISEIEEEEFMLEKLK